MYIVAMKPGKKRSVIILAAALVVALGAILFAAFRPDPEAYVAVGGQKYSVKAGTQEERIAFLKQFGWDVNEEPVEITEVTIPQLFNDVYETYNQIQLEQGMDLKKYAGKICKQWVYEITNYPGGESGVRATLLIYDGKVIGGDICSPKLDGFICGFAGQEGNSAMPPESTAPEASVPVSSSQAETPVSEDPASSAAAQATAEEAAQESSSEIPAAAWPTD